MVTGSNVVDAANFQGLSSDASVAVLRFEREVIFYVNATDCLKINYAASGNKDKVGANMHDVAGSPCLACHRRAVSCSLIDPQAYPDRSMVYVPRSSKRINVLTYGSQFQ